MRVLKLICIIFAVVMISGVLYGCNKSEKVDEEGTKEAAKTTQKTTQTIEEEKGNFNRTGYPIVDKKVTMKIFVRRQANHADYNEMPVVKNYEAKSNIHIEWIQVPDEAVKERKNLAFASNDLPDAFMGNGDVVFPPLDQYRYGSQGQLIALNDLIENYTEHIKDLLVKQPVLKSICTAPDGNMYSLFSAENYPHLIVPVKHYINIKWLDQLKMAVPETIDDFYKVLKAFKENDMNGNGSKDDEIPFCFPFWDNSSTSSPGMTYELPSLMGPWGYVKTVSVKDKKLSFSFMQDGWRDGLKFMNRLYEEGLLDQEMFTLEWSQFQAKGRKDPKILGGYAVLCDTQIVPENTAEYYKAFGPLEGPAGKKIFNVKDTFANSGKFVITSACKNPEIMIRWIDFLYSPEGSVEWNKGPKDVTWKIENGKVVDISKPEGFEGHWRNSNCPGGASACYAGFDPLPFSYDEDNLRYNKDAENYMRFAESETYPSTLFFEPGDSDELARLSAQIDPYIREMTAKFITGNVELNDTEWSKYLDTLEKMDIKKYIEILQKAYDVYIGG